MSDIHYQLLRQLESNPDASQRELAQAMGVSLGKLNYCLKALIDRGWVQNCGFRNSQNRLAYSYVLTPEGAKEKAAIGARFLKRKLAEYEATRREIEDLSAELNSPRAEGGKTIRA